MSSTFVSSSQLSSISSGLPLPFFPGSRPSNTVLTKEPWRSICPNLLFCLFLSVSISSLLVSTVLRSSPFFCAPSKISLTCNAKFTFQMLQSFLCHSFAGSMSMSVRLCVFFSWRLRDPHTRSFFLLKASFANANATSYFTFTSAVLD